MGPRLSREAPEARRQTWPELDPESSLSRHLVKCPLCAVPALVPVCPGYWWALWERVAAGSGSPLLSRPRGAVGSGAVPGLRLLSRPRFGAVSVVVLSSCGRAVGALVG